MKETKKQILNDIKKAMQNGEEKVRDTLRILISAIKNEEIKIKKREKELNNEEIIEIIARSIKQRKDSITEYLKGNRKDLADKEQAEIVILKKYLPKQLSEEEIKKEIKKIITQISVNKPANFGKIMGLAMQKLKGKTNGPIVRKIIENELNK